MPLDRATYQRIFASGVKYGMSRRAPMDSDREFQRLVLAGLVALVTAAADSMSEELQRRALDWMQEVRAFHRENLQEH